MDIRRVGDHECINCGECISACPTKAIQWKGSKWILPANEIDVSPNASDEEIKAAEAARDAQNQKIAKRNRVVKTVVAVAMIATLAGTLVYYNFVDREAPPVIPPVESDTESDETVDGTVSPDAPEKPKRGTEVGNECYGMILPYITEEGSFSISAGKGKITVLNFWGTWCGPCKAELPHFSQIATEYPDSTQVVTIHSEYGMDKSEAYIQENYPDSDMLFTYDQNDAFYNLLVKGSSWPTTVILDENGVILYKRVGKMEYAELKAILDAIIVYEIPAEGTDYDELIALVNAAADAAREAE